MEKEFANEFVGGLKKRINRLRTCRYHWKQFMIIRGILLEYNRFVLKYPYHECVLPTDTILLQKCRTILDATNKGFGTYTTEQQRYLSKYFFPTAQKTIQSYYERKKRLLFFLAIKGLCPDTRRYAIAFLYY